MADVTLRVWRSGPRKVKRTAWGYTFQRAGRQVRKFDASWSKEDAQAALAKRLEELRAGAVRTEQRTLADVVDEYLRYKADGGKRSLKEDRRILKTRIVPAFGAELPIAKLTGAAIAQYERGRVGQVSAYTVANELTVLRHMLRLAKRWGYVDQVPDVDMPKKPEARQRYLEADEIARLLGACARSRNPYLAAIVTVAVNTGMRKGEILGLTWERVDLSTGRITLYQTKSGKPRGVPMNRAVYEALVALQPRSEHRAGLVFTRSADRAWGQIRTAFAKVLERAEIAGFRFHDLRHTAASHMVMRGASLKDVQEILGHSDYKMTQRYAHLSPSHLRAAVDRLDGLTPEVPARVPAASEPAVSAHGSAQSGKMNRQRRVSSSAPVAQVDRAAVS